MKKAKKTKVPTKKTALDRLATQLHAALRRETKNIIEIGNLLIESRKHLDHGEWQPWVAENSGLSVRTAQNYLNAAEYVARQSKSATVADFTNLAPTVLYWLAADHYSEQGKRRSWPRPARGASIRRRRTRSQTRSTKSSPDDDDDDDDDTADHAEEAPPDPEIEAILDGSPPAVPPPAPNPPPTDFALRDFDDAISALKPLATKFSEQFAGTIHSGDDLEKVASFIRLVANQALRGRRDNADEREKAQGEKA